MLNVDFFSDIPVILGGTQTLVGVCVTLMVLCIFSGNNNNFIYKLCEEFWEDMSKMIAAQIIQLKRILDERKGKDQTLNDYLSDESFWRAIANNNTERQDLLLKNRAESKLIPQLFFQEAQKIVNSVNNQMETLLKRREDSYIEFYLFIITLLVITLDSLHIQESVGCVFTLILTALSFIYTTCLWYIYYAQINPPSQPKKYKLTWYRWGEPAIIVVFAFFIWALLQTIVPNIFVNYFLMVIICAFAVAYGLRRRWKAFSLERHNRRLVVKHSFYIIFVSAFVTVLFCLMMNSTFFTENLSFIPESYFISWSSHALDFCNPVYARVFFVTYVVISAFFIPIFCGFLVSREYGRKATGQVNRMFYKYTEQSDNKQSEYVEIIKSIIKDFLGKNQ